MLLFACATPCNLDILTRVARILAGVASSSLVWNMYSLLTPIRVSRFRVTCYHPLKNAKMLRRQAVSVLR